MVTRVFQNIHSSRLVYHPNTNNAKTLFKLKHINKNYTAFICSHISKQVQSYLRLNVSQCYFYVTARKKLSVPITFLPHICMTRVLHIVLFRLHEILTRKNNHSNSHWC